MIQETVIFIIN